MPTKLNRFVAATIEADRLSADMLEACAELLRAGESPRKVADTLDLFAARVRDQCDRLAEAAARDGATDGTCEEVR